MMHELKIWPENYAAVASGTKRYEVRKADRPFKAGDHVELREWDPDYLEYTGRSMTFRITHVTEPGEWGLPEDLCVFGIQ